MVLHPALDPAMDKLELQALPQLPVLTKPAALLEELEPLSLDQELEPLEPLPQLMDQTLDFLAQELEQPLLEPQLQETLEPMEALLMANKEPLDMEHLELPMEPLAVSLALNQVPPMVNLPAAASPHHPAKDTPPLTRDPLELQPHQADSLPRELAHQVHHHTPSKPKSIDRK